MQTADSPFQIKSLNEAGVIEGLGAFFGNADHGGDIIMPGAFTKTLAERAGAPIPMLFCHDLKRPIGAWSEATETSEGLAVKGRITLSTREGSEAYALAKDGALGGLSIGYKAVNPTRQGANRILNELQLFEVSPVAVPMNGKATIRDLKTISTPRDLESLLREEAGMSSRKAKAAASAAWKAIQSQDEEADAEAELAAILSASTARLAKLGVR